MQIRVAAGKIEFLIKTVNKSDTQQGLEKALLDGEDQGGKMLSAHPGIMLVKGFLQKQNDVNTGNDQYVMLVFL